VLRRLEHLNAVLTDGGAPLLIDFDAAVVAPRRTTRNVPTRLG
jgi:hypothetical protein